jgi:hypothetical protein
LAIALPPHRHSAISDQPRLPHKESTKPDFVNGLLGVAVALIGTQMTWTVFLGWVVLIFLR